MTFFIQDQSGEILTAKQFRKKYNRIAFNGDLPPKAALDIVGATFVVRSVSDQDLSEEVRNQRNSLLADTDWMALSDNTMTPEWASYRQGLRDITAQEGFPFSVVWPTKP